MDSKSSLIFLFLFLIFPNILITSARKAEFNPYDVLQLTRSSSTDEIRKQYKKLAKEWHPDKNKDPDAGEKFMQINKAYEILGDEKKKEQFDSFGRVDDNQHHAGGHQSDGQFLRTPFDGFHFTGGGHGGDSNDNMITDRYLQNHILPQSYEKPYFFFATTDFCFSCMRIQPIWAQFTQDLEKLDVGFGVVDVDYQTKVVKSLHIPRVPCIGAIVNGRSIIFDSEQYSVKVLRQFTRKLLPDDLMTTVSISTIDSWLNGWIDNKVKVLFFGTHGLPTMRLQIPLYQVRDRVSSAYVDTSSPGSVQLMDRFDVEAHGETLLIFREDPETPVYAERQKQFSAADILSTLKSYKYLSLPRLGSPAIYDDLCPADASSHYRGYCVILTFDSTMVHGEEVGAFREFVAGKKGLPGVRFLYAYTNVQNSAMDVWERPSGDFKVAVIARREKYEVDVTWIDWCTRAICEKSLATVVSRLSSGTNKFANRSIKRYDIRDEMAAGLLVRIITRLKDWWDHFTYKYFDGDHTLTLISILSTTVCVVIVTFLANILTNNPGRRADATPSQPLDSVSRTTTPQYVKDPGKFTIYELRSHNFDKLIREALIGYRFILLFVDEQNKQRYVKRFANLLMPFNRTSYFMFGFMYIDKHLNWYQRLLAQTVGFKDELRTMSPQQCIGTVLAINGYRKCFNIYHPKTLNIRRQQQEEGAFIGLDDSSDSEHEAGNGHALNGTARTIDGDSLIAEDRLLDGLGNWVDRLFDGSLPKCKIEHWPAFPADEHDPAEELDDNKKEQ